MASGLGTIGEGFVGFVLRVWVAGYVARFFGGVWESGLRTLGLTAVVGLMQLHGACDRFSALESSKPYPRSAKAHEVKRSPKP